MLCFCFVISLFFSTTLSYSYSSLFQSVGQYNNLPNIYGKDSLFAFSGLDGKSNEEFNFVATFTEQEYGLTFHTNTERNLTLIPDFTKASNVSVLVATGDVLLVTRDNQTFLLGLAFSAWHTLVGMTESDSLVSVELEDSEWDSDEGCWITEDSFVGGIALANYTQESGIVTISVSFGMDKDEACTRALVGLKQDFTDTVEARLAIYQDVPELDDPGKDRLLKKCISVMKVKPQCLNCSFLFR